MLFAFEGEEIADYRGIRDKMREILHMSKGQARTDRAAAFVAAAREQDPNADGNLGTAVGYLGSEATAGNKLFGVGFGVFGEADPQEVAADLLANADADPIAEASA